MAETYACFINGKFYGAGDLEYMNELFRDYVITHGLYGKDDCTFRITTKEKAREIVTQSINDQYRRVFESLAKEDE
ncbi:hypothetical protein OZL92_20850 [Bacillus sonorensis]|uniref:Uncharacterized protein n=1 Tax=Bacillus sonorensis L12 TaxID=1274524 RepID=M5PF95_9BACI|nr:hypothetical protein [Bacillus sonorensis]EME76200.1 hypothetical protein BSONL12_04479 [Bacillus sonorensis L12]MCZ0074670.1 hypothetical protein [Bacillus sonorensis]MCZ0093778.1 hypothetical protein [Bacillus sonorensis]PAD61844.1 hypothetical protein CHH92_01955 [Bacillus sonorensis]